jgi:glycosyltransferase involved in cell wall biosynthesis
MDFKPLISIVIPTYNNEKYLPEAIESSLEQSYKNIEIIVVDDGSTDNTRELVKQYGSKVRYIYQENQGVSGARNTGIKNAAGNYLQFLDADDIILTRKLEIQVDFLENNPDYMVVYSDVRYFYGFDRTKLTQKDFKFYSGNIFKELLQGNFIVVHASLVRKSCIDNMTLFQSKFDPYEDWDFWLRISYAGYKFYYIDKVLTLCRGHSNNQSFNRLRMAKSGLNVVKSVNNYINTNSSREDLGIRRVLSCHHQLLGRVLLEHHYFVRGLSEIMVAWFLHPIFQLKTLVKGITKRIKRIFY